MASASAQDADLGDRHDDYRMSVANSRISMLDDHDRPLSLVSTLSYTPEIIAAARDRQRSLATEILGPNHHLVFPSPESSQVDSQDLGRLSSVSGLSEHPDRSPKESSAKPLPSPPAAETIRPPSMSANLKKGVEKSIGSPVAVSDSLGFAVKGMERGPSPSMRGMKSPRMSVFIEDLEGLNDENERPEESGKVSKTAATIVDWPLGTPGASPVPSSQVDAASAISPAGSSRTLIPLPQQAELFATVVSPQARKEPRMNFLSKFLRSKSPGPVQVKPIDNARKEQNTGREEKATEPEEKSPQDEAVLPDSFFDDESSDGEDDSQVGSAQQAVIASPVMVENGAATRVGLKEMLGSTSPTTNDNAALSTERVTKPDEGTPKGAGLSVQSTENGQVGAGLWKQVEPFSSIAPGLKRPSQQVPVRKDSISAPRNLRKVSFPAPAPLDIKPGHRFLRQSIVSTPYPTEEDEAQQQKRKKKVSISAPIPQGEAQSDTGLESVLTLVLHGGRDTAPRVKRIVLPTAQKVSPIIDSEKKNHPTTRAEATTDFDDENLFRLIRKEYASMRGIPRRFASTRTVRAVNLSHQFPPQQTNPTHFPFQEPETQSPNQPNLLSLFNNPRLGQTHHTWTHRLRSNPYPTSSPSTQPAASSTSSTTTPLSPPPPPPPPTPTLHLTHSFSPLRLTFALTTIFLLSIAATLLWIFLGVAAGSSSSNIKYQASSNNQFGVPVLAQGGEVGGGPGPGARVGSGAVLGALVLGLGWTGVAGWVVLSWLVM